MNKTKLIALIPFLVVTLCYGKEGKSLAAKSFKELEKIVATEITDQDSTLVICDVDETLLDFGYTYDFVLGKLDTLKNLGRLSAEKHLFYWTTFLKNHTPILVDDQQVEWFNNLQKETKVICLTSSWAGKYGVIESFCDHRYNSIKELKYNISNPFKDFDDKAWIPVGQIDQSNAKQFCYYNGIIFTHDFRSGYKASLEIENKTVTLKDKGLVLLFFLSELSKKAQWAPSKIIFIDDNQSFIENVKTAMEYTNIDCTVIQYTANAARVKAIVTDPIKCNNMKEEATKQYKKLSETKYETKQQANL